MLQEQQWRERGPREEGGRRFIKSPGKHKLSEEEVERKHAILHNFKGWTKKSGGVKKKKRGRE